MFKNKLSKLLDSYSDDLIRLGIYLVVILIVFGLALNLMLNREKLVTDATKELPEIEISTEPEVSTETELEPELEVNKSEEQDTDILVTNTPVTSEPVSDEKVTDELVASHRSPVTNSLTWPVQGEIINDYGLKYSEVFGDYRIHSGIDIQVEPDTQVKTAFAGKVVKVGETKAQRIIIEIEHENGYQTYYAHLAKALVKKGQLVKADEIIGQVNEPGTEESDLGPHLHFEVKQNQKFLNPKEFLEL